MKDQLLNRIKNYKLSKVYEYKNNYTDAVVEMYVDGRKGRLIGVLVADGKQLHAISMKSQNALRFWAKNTLRIYNESV